MWFGLNGKTIFLHKRFGFMSNIIAQHCEQIEEQKMADFCVIVPAEWHAFFYDKHVIFRKWIKTCPPCKTVIIDHSNEGGPSLVRFNNMAKTCFETFGENVNIVYVSQSHRTDIQHQFVHMKRFNGFFHTFNDDSKLTKPSGNQSMLMLGGCARPQKQVFMCHMFESGILNNPNFKWSFACMTNPVIRGTNAWFKKDFVKKYCFGDSDIFMKNYEKVKHLCPHILDIDPSAKKYTADFAYELYERAPCSLVLESEITNRDIRYTEKTIKAMFAGHFFVVMGNRYTLRSLHADGFQTFGDIIDEETKEPFINESYDELECNRERVEAVIEQAKRILKWNKNTFQRFIQISQPIRDHNLSKTVESCYPKVVKIIESL